MPLTLSDRYVEALNENYRGGIFVRAIDFEENPIEGIWRYFVDYPDVITFNGRSYEPVHIIWSNLKTSGSMPIDAAQISVSNIGKQVGRYVKEFDVTENRVILRLLHMDLLQETTGHWLRPGEILAVQADQSLIVFTVGRRLGRNVLPRKVYLTSEFPGLSADQPKIL